MDGWRAGGRQEEGRAPRIQKPNSRLWACSWSVIQSARACVCGTEGSWQWSGRRVARQQPPCRQRRTSELLQSERETRAVVIHQRGSQITSCTYHIRTVDVHEQHHTAPKSTPKGSAVLLLQTMWRPIKQAATLSNFIQSTFPCDCTHNQKATRPYSDSSVGDEGLRLTLCICLAQRPKIRCVLTHLHIISLWLCLDF